MRVFSITLLLAALVLFGASFGSAKDMETAYLMGVADYFDIPYEMVYDVFVLGVVTEEVPVIFSVAGKAGVDPRKVARERVEGASWQSICKKHELSAADFYIKVKGKVISGTFIPILKKFKKTNKKKWNEIILSDSDYINLVNLHFISSHYKYPVHHIMAMRDFQKKYPRISNHIFAGKMNKAKKALASKDK